MLPFVLRACLVGQTASARPAPAPLPKDFAAKAEAYLDARARAGRFTGAVRIDVDGRTVLRRAWGCADWSTRRPFTPETPGYLFSLTKSFTAGAVLLLAEHGKLSLDDPAGKWLPDLPEAWKAPTVRQYLNHTSGISARDGVAWYRAHGLEDEDLALVTDAPAATKPGSTFAYSNLGYVVLGAMVAAASGRPYVRFVQEELLTPLGLRTAGTGGFVAGQKAVARGHTAFGGGLVPIDQSLAGIVGAGDLHASVDDMVRWRAAIDGPGIFSETTRELLHQAPVAVGDGSRYGYGWMYDGQWPLWGHSGAGAGSQSDLVWLPDLKMTIAVLQNSDESGGTIPSDALEGWAYGKPLPTQRLPSLEALDRTQGVYRGENGEEATVYLQGDAPTVVRAGEPEKVMGPAGERRFEGGDTGAEFRPRADGWNDLTLRPSGKKALRMTRVSAAAGPEAYAGTYGIGGWTIRFERRGRWLANVVGVVAGSEETLPIPLIPAGGDRFVLPKYGTEVRFTRDAGGKVVAAETWREGKRVMVSKRAEPRS